MFETVTGGSASRVAALTMFGKIETVELRPGGASNNFAQGGAVFYVEANAKKSTRSSAPN